MLEFEFKDLKELRQRFDPKIVNQALTRTINDIARKSKTRVSEEVRQVYNVKARDVNQSFSLKRANAHEPSAMLRYVGHKIDLIDFGVRVRNKKIMATSKTGKRFKTTRKQARVKVKKTNGLQVIRGKNAGFVADNRVYARQGKTRTPLQTLYGPSVAEMVDDRNVVDPVNLLIKTDFHPGFDRNMKFYLGKKVGLY